MCKNNLGLQQPEKAGNALKVVALDLTLPAGVRLEGITGALQQHRTSHHKAHPLSLRSLYVSIQRCQEQVL